MSENQEQAAAKAKTANEIYCPSCGAIISKYAEICPKCGVRQLQNTPEKQHSHIFLAVSFALIIVSCFLPFVNLIFVKYSAIDLFNKGSVDFILLFIASILGLITSIFLRELALKLSSIILSLIILVPLIEGSINVKNSIDFLEIGFWLPLLLSIANIVIASIFVSGEKRKKMKDEKRDDWLL